MSHDGWPPHFGARVLVLGGIRSGKSEYAESLLSGARSVRYLATALADGGDPAFADRVAAHRERRPQSWITVETYGDPAALVTALGQAAPDDMLIVDDLGGWVVNLLDRADAQVHVSRLAAAVAGCPARVVLVSPEVGLSVVPPSEAGVRFADLMGLTNQAVAAACDAVALVVAGHPVWLTTADGTTSGPGFAGPAVTAAGSEPADLAVPGAVVGGAVTAAGSAAATTAGAPIAVTLPAAVIPSPEVLTPSAAAPKPTAALTESTQALPIVATGLVIQQNMDLPIPDSDARDAARDHLNLLDVPGSGLGRLAEIVLFAAGAQGRAVPLPWQQPRMLLLHGTHDGDVAAGQTPHGAALLAAQARRGEGPIGLLAAEYGVSLQIVDTATAEAIEHTPAAELDTVEGLLRYGWQLADEAADSGVDLLMLGSCGAGAEAAAAAVVSAVTGAEVPGLLSRVVSADGTVDDAAWMLRCAAVCDAMHRVRGRVLAAKEMLTELGGPDLAVAAGVILGATARRTPVLLDGPVGVAAGLIARDLGSQSRLWCALADTGRHPTTVLAADVLGLTPLTDLNAGLGEGTGALLALPLLRSALTLAASLPALPPLLDEPPAHLQEPEDEPDDATDPAVSRADDTSIVD
ncbi:bifunctional adenosylcobinamide kinase/adenosylcobinamide-phosphate guanylyltransferase [Catellatospora sichuanensis]|uniref:bifunctional adenosylcobinamide kinase/adenosylcobinamide-phosphate guanylyltransferase n=1 Tax=Catellatospora sichuanensis TaxID=1969805 RepID=UPI001182D1CE|nr:bifunctional adenosylcobinamide kinase/adenosylcobinamide-phosphate guanylyltransferase [Catellatospora sichuanensis]